VNDAAPDGDTNFDDFGNTNSAANANGAIRFVVGAKATTPIPTDPSASVLKITDGVFESGADTTSPAIGFTTAGYTTGNAQVYYAAVSSGEGAPAALSGYTGYLGEFAEAAHTAQTISLQAADNDVYLLAVKDGKVSAPYLIPRGWTGNWSNPYMTFYVKSNGKDTNDGITANTPLKTIDKALEILKETYEAGPWPADKCAAIVIRNTVNVSGRIVIDGNVHPPIDLKGESGVLKVVTNIIPNGNLLYLENNAKAAMEDGLTLQGSGSKTDRWSRGVLINEGCEFTMNGGVIKDHGYGSGSGVYIYGGTFIMNKGKISNNDGQYSGGGVELNMGEFIMNDGEISGNTTSATSDYDNGTGGGVYIGGVSNLARFTMNGGVIKGNTAGQYGGGVGIAQSGKGIDGKLFVKTGGTIYGSDGGANANYVRAYSGFYPTGSPISKRGHAIGVFNGAWYLDTTVSGNLEVGDLGILK
jgi:hypothetical protein